MPATPPCYPPIEAHGVIGDLSTAALVAKDGTLDFLCLPRFDSPTVFASLLDAEKGGCFSLAPELPDPRLRQIYLPDTNVLLTRFLSPQGVAEISDFMPVHGRAGPSRVVRRVKTVRGELRFRVRCAPRFGYALVPHQARAVDGGVEFVAEDGTTLRLSSSIPLSLEEGDAVAAFTLHAGQSAAFVLEHVDGREPVGAGAAYVSRAFKETVNFWRGWMERSTYRGRWRDEVNRAALTLKLLYCRETGAVVAAPTFGLPERMGGVRNWDYRYTWIRDASFTLYALIRLGLTGESRDFVRWLISRFDGMSDPGGMQIVYGLDGRTDLPERTLEHLEGYRGSRPVRVGNAAQGQLQLDVYGELIDSLYLYDKYAEPTSHGLWEHVSDMVEWVCANWRQPDEGIWEVRSGRRRFLYSRLMCWVAVDRGVRLAGKRSLPAPLERWRAVRDEIYRDVWENFWSEEQGAFVRSLGSTRLDAACLLMPLVRFVSPTDPRWLSTLKAVGERLVEDSLVHRYERGEDEDDPEGDGLPGEEGTFTMCSFWYVECLSRSGDVQQARFLFEKMLGYANHLGLYAEELGPSGEHLGNFPQAFTHLALISAAYDLDRRLSGTPPLP
jgi:GH15 family glucan-1,4-alpha-glucosidase